FFFSSRRRHTRSDRDWSSDVCSSDLLDLVVRKGPTSLSVSFCHPYFCREPRSDQPLCALRDLCVRQVPSIRTPRNVALPQAGNRSEERRVGKERRRPTRRRGRTTITF